MIKGRLLAVFIAVFGFCQTGGAICVHSRLAYLREGPSSRSAKKWTVGKYMPLKKIGRQGNWIKVEDLDGEVYWVYGGSVTRKYRCMVVRVSYTYMRTGPGSHYPKAEIPLADKYTPFKKIERKDDWVHVADDYGQDFWIYGGNLWEPIITQSIDF